MSKKVDLTQLTQLVKEEVKKYSRRLYDQKLWEAHVEPQQFSIYEKRHFNDSLITELFSLDEKEIDSEKTDQVTDAITSEQWQQVTPEEFLESLAKSNKPEMLTKYSADELSRMVLYKLEGYDIGFALKQYVNPVTEEAAAELSEIVAVHNNEPGVGGIGKIMLKAAIDSGGCYLDHFDGFLSQLYGSMGFEEYMRYDFNPDYAPEDFEQKYGRQDVIYRYHRDCEKPQLPESPEDEEEETDD